MSDLSIYWLKKSNEFYKSTNIFYKSENIDLLPNFLKCIQIFTQCNNIFLIEKTDSLTCTLVAQYPEIEIQNKILSPDLFNDSEEDIIFCDSDCEVEELKKLSYELEIL